MMEQASDAIFVFDPRGALRDADTGGRTQLGLDGDDFAGADLTRLLGDASRKALERLSPGSGLAEEVCLRRGDGTAVEIDASLKRLRDGRVQAICRDVGRRKAAALAEL